MGRAPDVSELYRLILDLRNDFNRHADDDKENFAKLIDRFDGTRYWQGWMMGGLAILTVLVLPVLFVVIQKYLK